MIDRQVNWHNWGGGLQLTDVIRILPPISHLQIRIMHNQPQKPIMQLVTLFLRQAIDVLEVMPNCVQTPPSSHRISPDNRMHGLQGRADVFGGPACTAVDLEALCFRRD